MSLSREERARIRYHLGFPNVGSITAIALGFPAAGHPMFILESAMDRLLPEAEPKVREVLLQCECIEKQMQEARSRMKVVAVTGVTLRSREEIEDLEEQYVYWTDALADSFNGVKNPFSRRHQRLDGGYTVIEPG